MWRILQSWQSCQLLRRRLRARRPIPLHAEILAYLHITATLLCGGALRLPRRR